MPEIHKKRGEEIDAISQNMTKVLLLEIYNQ
jgi:hypothetical protein